MANHADILIVGGGISGRLLQIELQQAGASTLVFDQPENNHSTRVAAGLANPLVGKFFTIGWRAKEIFNDLASYYTQIESRLGAPFFRPCKMKRVISSAGEQNIWLSKAHKEKYVGFCSFSNEGKIGLNTQFGILEVMQGGEMDTDVFLDACAEKMPTLNQKFDHTELNLADNLYKDISFDKIVFCEGYQVMNNPLFAEERFIIPTKGELLEIETDLQPDGDIYLGGVFLQHIADRRWRVGSTYQVNETNLQPTDMMREDLKAKLDKVLAMPYTIVDHRVGVRPASVDRKPILGRHKQHQNVYIMNGMGSKAVSLAPLLARDMCAFLLQNTPLDTEISINRFI